MGRYWVANGGRHLANDEWLTPPWMLSLLGPFDLDPCAADRRPWDAADANLTISDDGMSKKWKGRVWLNPPFGKGLNNWITRLAEHGNGIAIMPLRSTDAGWFHDSILAAAASLFFLRGRVRFHSIDGAESGPCPHASLLIAYGASNSHRLRRALKSEHELFSRGKFIALKHAGS